jgi:DNA repair exonuclease SbcCD ATPase subunit
MFNMRMKMMSEPQIVCPQCSTSIKLTESLAAPLLVQARKQFEQQLAQKETDFARREAALRTSQEAITKARESIDAEVARKLKTERTTIAEAEAKKARLALANDLEQRDRQVANLQQNLTANNAKLAEAQQAQATSCASSANWTMPAARSICRSRRRCSNRSSPSATRPRRRPKRG